MMAAEIGQVYKCESCGIILEVVHEGAGEVACCDGPAKLLVPNTVDAAQEKHVPVVTAEDGQVKVSVGSVPHPMVPEHYIEWIEIIRPDGRWARQYLQPGQDPTATFCGPIDGVVAREHCNLHGLWKGEA